MHEQTGSGIGVPSPIVGSGPHAPVPPPGSFHLGRRTRRILVAEDDADMRRLVAAVLRADGYRVVEAEDGGAVIDRLESTIWSARPDLFGVIVTDMQMPGLSGLDVLAALRCTHWSTPLIVMTAYADPAVRAEARSLGAAAFLEKPLDLDQLRAAVRRAMAAT